MLGAIGSLEQHLERLQNERIGADVVQSNNANADTLPATSNPAEAVARRRKRAREATSSAQSTTTSSPQDSEKKRAKPAPLPITEPIIEPITEPITEPIIEPPLAQRASAPRRSARRHVSSHIATGVVPEASAPRRSARRGNNNLAPTIRRSTRKRNIISYREYHGERNHEGAVNGRETGEESDNLVQTANRRESTLDHDAIDEYSDAEEGIADAPAKTRHLAPKSFDERFDALMKFKEEFGHCNAPIYKSKHHSLGWWCSNMRRAYKQIKKGERPQNTLSNENIRRLEEAGFKWTLMVTQRSTFDERFEDLLKFKLKFGYCNVPVLKSSEYEYSSLGHWCGTLRTSYRKMEMGKPLLGTPFLSQENIRRLENLGFLWNQKQNIFDERFEELMEFKEKFGHCFVPCKKSNEYRLLSQWCKRLRNSYKSIQNGEKPHCKLTDHHIRRLEEAGFKWRTGRIQQRTFDEHFEEYMEFKEKFGHWDASQTKYGSSYPGLGDWCNRLRVSYKKMQKGETSRYALTADGIRRLEEVGFKWSPRQRK